MPDIRLLHNPRCSKSRAALDLLRARGIEPELVDYVGAPLDRDALADMQRALGVPAGEMLRRDDLARFGLDPDAELSDVEVLDLLATRPSLLQRPIALRGSRAVIGRPPERVLELLD